jgi:predicted porin
LAARQQLLGLAGSFGTVATGYLQTTGYDFAVKFDPLSGSAASPLQSVTKGGGFYIGSVAGAARAQRALAYISPDFGGIKFAVNYSTALVGYGDLTVADTAANGIKTSAYLVSGNYDNGPLALGAVYLGTSTTTGGATVTEYSLGGSYDLGAAKLLATYQSNKASTASKANIAMSFSAVVPVGTNAVAFSYGANSMATANSNGNGYTLGYLHTLSKTTTAYAAYHSMSNGTATNAYSVAANLVAGGATTLGGGSSLVGFGLRKKF